MIQRLALFNGLDVVSEGMTVTIEVDHRPARVRPLPLERWVPRAAAAIRSSVEWVWRRRGAARRTPTTPRWSAPSRAA
ncbi:hypothetical protein ACFQYP_21630 [Nonomuraea antimicrobica]